MAAENRPSGVDILPQSPIEFGSKQERGVDVASLRNLLHDIYHSVNLGGPECELFMPECRVVGRLVFEVGPAVRTCSYSDQKANMEARTGGLSSRPNPQSLSRRQQ